MTSKILILTCLMFGISLASAIKKSATEQDLVAAEQAKPEALTIKRAPYPIMKIIPAVQLGFPVRASSIYNMNFFNYMLDYKGQGGQSWTAAFKDKNQWIQVTSILPKSWSCVATQGRGDADQWVTEFVVTYSSDGMTWTAVDNGRIFMGNYDRDTPMNYRFDTPVTARTLRIQPITWHNYIALRFEAYFQNNY